MPVQSPNWIAEQQVVIVHPDGRRVQGHIAVGEPYTLDGGTDPTGTYETHCPIEIDSLWSRARPMIGCGSLQALLLGIQFLGMTLHAFIENGGRVLDVNDGSDIQLASLFGPLLRNFGSPGNDASE